ncbi:MAG: hypothetical protein KA239_06465 [Bacteroidia bacterium]|nr:hypothetical protein [Bacteroidia bacterium]
MLPNTTKTNNWAIVSDSRDTTNTDHWVLDNDFSNDGGDPKGGSNRPAIAILNAKIKEEKESIQDLKATLANHNVRQKQTFDISRFVTLVKPKHPAYFNASQSWIGHVLEVDENGFYAKLSDQNDPTTFETASFNKKSSDYPIEDSALIQVGAVFYWSVGFESTIRGWRKKSVLRFKRSPSINEDELDSLYDKADALFDQLNWE